MCMFFWKWKWLCRSYLACFTISLFGIDHVSLGCWSLTPECLIWHRNDLVVCGNIFQWGRNPIRGTWVIVSFQSVWFSPSGRLVGLRHWYLLTWIGSEVEVSSIDWLDVSTMNEKNPLSGVAIRTSEWGKSQWRSRIHSYFRVKKIPSAKLWLRRDLKRGTTRWQIRCVYF